MCNKLAVAQLSPVSINASVRYLKFVLVLVLMYTLLSTMCINYSATLLSHYFEHCICYFCVHIGLIGYC